VKLNFIKKRQSIPKRQPNLSRSIMPIDKYYSGMSQRLNSEGRPRPGAWVTAVARWCGVFVILLVLLFNTTLNQVGVKIAHTNTSGVKSKYRSDQEYIDRARAVFSGNLFYRSKLTFNGSDFEQVLAASMPEADGVVSVVPLVGTKLLVGATITDPLAHVSIGSGQNAIVGMNGRLLEVSDSAILSELTVSTPELRIEPAIDLEIGGSILTSGETALLQLLKTEFDGSNVSRPKLDSFRYNVEKRELQAFFVSKSYFAKFTTERDARLQVGALVATLEAAAKEQGMVPAQYVDVRVEGRVFIL
jgi:hypothetical protein